MKKIVAIAQNTFKEAIRSKILLVTVLLAVLCIIAAMTLKDLSLGQQEKIFINLAVAATSFVVMATTLIVAAFQIVNERHRNTLHNILVKGVSRSEFLIGKFIGVAITSLTVIAIAVILIILGLQLQGSPLPPFFMTSFLFLQLQAMIMTAIVLLSASFLRPLLAIFTSIAVFFIGNMSQELYLATLNNQATFFSKGINTAIHYLLPNLDALNLKTLLLYQVSQEPIQTLSITLYALIYTAVTMLVACLIFNKQQL